MENGENWKSHEQCAYSTLGPPTSGCLGVGPHAGRRSPSSLHSATPRVIHRPDSIDSTQFLPPFIAALKASPPGHRRSARSSASFAQ